MLLRAQDEYVEGPCPHAELHERILVDRRRRDRGHAHDDAADIQHRGWAEIDQSAVAHGAGSDIALLARVEDPGLDRHRPARSGRRTPTDLQANSPALPRLACGPDRKSTRLNSSH